MIKSTNNDEFIAVRKNDIINLITHEKYFNKKTKNDFIKLCNILESYFHNEFYKKIEEIEDLYFIIDPETPTDPNLSNEEINYTADEFKKKLEEILIYANYEKLSKEEITHALNTNSVFKLSFSINFNDFDDYLLYKRGESIFELKRKYFFGILKKKVEIKSYDKVLIFLKFKDENYFINKALGKNKDAGIITKLKGFFSTRNKEKILSKLNFKANSINLKLFKNIPKSDLEIIFPNTQVFMNPKDMALIGIPAIGGILSVFFTQFLKTLPLIVSVIAILFTGNVIKNNELLDNAVRSLLGIGGLLGYIMLQLGNYKGKKLKFMKNMADNLFFKNLDSYEGVFYNLIDSAEKQELKETIIGYYFLLLEKKPISKNELDKKIEDWIYNKTGT